MNQPSILLANIFFAPYTYGGATIVAEEVARHLSRDHGWAVSVLSAVSRPDMPPYAIRKVETNGIANFLINLPDVRPFAQMYSNPEVTEVASRLIHSLQPDLVHLHCIQELGTGVLHAARSAGVPTIVSTHDFWWICERQFMIRSDGRYCGQNPVRIENCRTCVVDMARSLTRFRHLQNTASQANLMTFPSAFARDMYEASGMTSQSDAVWENGVTLPGADFFQRQAARRMKEPRLVFGYCGGPSDIKGWPQLSKAFRSLERSDFRVVLADGSPDGSWWRETPINEMPGEWSVSPRFSQSEMDSFWSEIDVLLFPSQWKETFGLTIREALARGIRVIQTDSGGTTEHAGPDRDRMLKIGGGARPLQRELEHALDRVDRYAAPVSVRSFAEQAREFIALANPLLASRPSEGTALQAVLRKTEPLRRRAV